MGTPLPIILPGPARELTDRASVAREECRADFDTLVREHGAALYALAARMTAVRSDAEDLAQETLYRAWRSIHRFRRDAGVRTWLYRILQNTHRTMWRRPSLALLPAELAHEGGDPEAVASRRDLLSRVLHAIDRLQCLVP